MKKYAAFLCVFAFTPALKAQNVITTAVPFLMISPDARASGFGETGVASAPDVSSQHWNAAKLAFADKDFGFSLSHAPWQRAIVPNVDLGYLSLYVRPDTASAFGGSVRYFSMGEVSVISNTGKISQYHPYELAADLSYSHKLNKRFSLALTGRYIASNLAVQRSSQAVAKSGAIDLAGFYQNEDLHIANKKSILRVGLALTNMGPKIKYNSSPQSEFLPANLRLGQGLQIELDSKHSISIQYEFNKLLVPTPPVYALDTNGNIVLNAAGQPIIYKGKNPDRSAVSGMLNSFNDAPGGFREELSEVSVNGGIEFWYLHIIAARAGYIYEAPRKGNLQCLTLGTGLRLNVFGLDFSYLVSTNNRRSPIQETYRLSLQLELSHLVKQHHSKKGFERMRP